MGQDKALLPVDGRPLLAKLSLELQALGMQVTIAAGSEERADAYREVLAASGIEIGQMRFVTDQYPDCGPMAGLHAALTAISQSGCHDYVFVIACDMPSLSTGYAARLASQTGFANAQGAAFIGASSQPFHALYHTRAIPILAALLSTERYRMMDLLEQLQSIIIEPQGASEEAAFMNVNTPGAYRYYLAREL